MVVLGSSDVHHAAWKRSIFDSVPAEHVYSAGDIQNLLQGWLPNKTGNTNNRAALDRSTMVSYTYIGLQAN
jgi:hypothetical protein